MNKTRLKNLNAIIALSAIMGMAIGISGCTSTPVPPMEVALNDVASGAGSNAEPVQGDAGFSGSSANGSDSVPSPAEESTDRAAPESSTLPSGQSASSETTRDNDENQDANLSDQPQTAESAIATARVQQAVSTPAPSPAVRQPVLASIQPANEAKSTEASSAQTDTTQLASSNSVAARPQRNSFLSSLFSNEPPRPARSVDRGGTNTPVTNPSKPRIQKVATAATQPQPVASGASLPGVKAESLFEIKRKSGTYDDSDVDVNENQSPVRVASVTGLARLAPNGLAVQHSGVDVACLKPQLVKVLKRVEKKFGKKVVVTSGYRSRKHNRRARGAKNSLHMYCAAADIQISGVSKWTLAKYLRTLPGRGGVGTYCHTKSVHIDIGPERDWNWRCRRSKKRR